MERVSFEVACAIKVAGYPQVGQRYQYTYEGTLVDLVKDGGICYGPVSPTYLEVWLWLWREKRIFIKVSECTCYISINGKFFSGIPKKDPEEAIVATIDYLVDNNLIK